MDKGADELSYRRLTELLDRYDTHGDFMSKKNKKNTRRSLKVEEEDENQNIKRRSVTPAKNRSLTDKIVDKLIGDDPEDRCPLICRFCSTMNGFLLPEQTLPISILFFL